MPAAADSSVPSSRGRFARAIGKRARALRRAQRAASAAAVTLVAADMRCAECYTDVTARAATLAAQRRRAAAVRAQGMLLGGLLGASGAFHVLAEQLRVSLGPLAAPRLRLCELEAKVDILDGEIGADVARRLLRHARRRRDAAHRSMARSILQLRALQPRVGARSASERVDLASVMAAV